MIARRTVLFMLALLLALPVLAQDQQFDQQAAMKAWQAAATPGPMHAFWAKMAGKWKTHSKMWMEPGDPPMESDGEVDMEMVLGGRYLQERFHGTSMGQPFEGYGLTGYDNVTGTVTAIWCDNMSTGMAVMTGKAAAPGEPLELTGTYADPVTKQMIAIRGVTTYQDEDHHTFEYFMHYPGEDEFKSMEIRYERVK